jgi:hypothetical protein
VISTNRHLMQGQYELSAVKWENRRLSGKAMVVAREPFKIIVALNGHSPSAQPNLAVSADGKLATLTLSNPENETLEWSIQCQ